VRRLIIVNSTVDKYVIKILGTMVHGKMQQFK